MDGVIIVTVPSEVSQRVVRRAVTFARRLGIPIIGIIENMSVFLCPNCGAKIDIFQFIGGRNITDELSIPFLGRIPIDEKICEDADKGMPFIIEHADSPASKAFLEIFEKVESFLECKQQSERIIRGGE